MEKWQHLPYLLAAYILAWMGVFGYLLRLVRKHAGLARRLRSLEEEK